MSRVKFLSYDGEYPNLCRGTLKLEIDGEEVAWNRNLVSGGSVWFSKDYSEEHVERGEWSVEFPDNFPKDAELRQEIARVVNENVRHGCCGGCI